MVFKTIVASIIAALLAGGVVYFGMPAESVGAGSVSLRSSTQTAQAGSQQAQTKPQDTSSEETGQDAPQIEERWIDKFVTGPLRRTIRPEPKPVRQEPKRQTPKKWEKTNDTPDTGLTEKSETVRQTVVQEKPEEKPQKRAQDKAKPESDAPRYYVLENGELSEIDVLPGPTTSDAVNPDASFRILTVSNQAKLIKQPDLRDRAYLDIVDYAVSEGLYTASISAMEEIDQVELRDTARSRIAIAYARSGDSRAAFGLIDDVEVDELQDVLRLQVIEAMILPDRLPDGL